MIVIALGEAELGEDALHVLRHRSFGDPQPTGNPRVGSAFGHEGENVALARRQAGKRIVDPTRRDELLYEHRIDDRTSLDDALDRLQEVVDVRDATLQQIPVSPP